MEVQQPRIRCFSSDLSCEWAVKTNPVVRHPQVSIVELQMDVCCVKIAITKQQLHPQKICIILSQGSGGK